MDIYLHYANIMLRNKEYTIAVNVLTSSYKFPQSNSFFSISLIVSFLPSGHRTVTITIFTSASEANTGGCTFSIIQLDSSNFFNIDMASVSGDIITGE